SHRRRGKRGDARAEARAPFLNGVGRKFPHDQRGATAPLHSLKNALRPTYVKERPGALAAASPPSAVIRGSGDRALTGGAKSALLGM
ncbi:MAG: hypothetical protein KBH14_14700, partial [Vicinamibacteria bacterium]|nr:hypothetical protein [Vicinamibacteria bacterium]